jgi:hypothetical protein
MCRLEQRRPWTVNDLARDNPAMNTAKVDSKKRILLPNGHPGDLFEIQQQDDDHIVLVRLPQPAPATPMTYEACLAAMESAPLHPAMTWEQLRQWTREA